MRIGIDMMGGDYAPGSVIRGAILARESLPVDVEIVLMGNQDILSRYAEEHQLDVSGLSIEHTLDDVGMEDHPLKAFKEKPKAGLFLGQRLLAAGDLDGFCSAGNTGAMMVGAMQIINSIPGMEVIICIAPTIIAPVFPALQNPSRAPLANKRWPR